MCCPLLCTGLPSPGSWASGPESRRGRWSSRGHNGVGPALGKSPSPDWAHLEPPTCRVPSAPWSLTLMTALRRPDPGLCSLGPVVLSPRGVPIGFCFPASQRTSLLSELWGSSARTQRPSAPQPRWRRPRGALGRTQLPPPPGPAPPVLTQRGGYGLATRCAGSDPHPLTASGVSHLPLKSPSWQRAGRVRTGVGRLGDGGPYPRPAWPPLQLQLPLGLTQGHS